MWTGADSAGALAERERQRETDRADPTRVAAGAGGPQFLIGFQSPAQSVLEPLAAALALGALVLLALRSDARVLRPALALAAIAVGGLLLNLILIAVSVDDLITRNVIALWVPAALVGTSAD